MERLEHRNPSYGVDFADMHLIDIRAELKNFTIDGPVIHTDIGRLAMRERSGFVVEDLAGCLCIANGCIDIREGHIRTAKSNIELPSLSLIGLDWALYKISSRRWTSRRRSSIRRCRPTTSPISRPK